MTLRVKSTKYLMVVRPRVAASDESAPPPQSQTLQQTAQAQLAAQLAIQLAKQLTMIPIHIKQPLAAGV
jgi:hypothetical protein